MRFLFLFIISLNLFSSEPNFRLYSESQTVSLKNTEGKVEQFPSGIRATETDDGFIIFNDKENKYKLYTNTSPSLKKVLLPEKPNSCNINKASTEVFFNEAKESIEQIKKSNRIKCEKLYAYYVREYPQGAKEYEDCELNFKKNFPSFVSLLEKTSKQLKELESSPKKEEILKSKLEDHRRSLFNKKNNVVKIHDFQKTIFDIYNPEKNKIKFSDTTIVVPISLDWINSNEKLRSWFGKEWIGKGIMSPFKGKSGEGIYADDLPVIQKKLLELRDYAHALSFDSIISGKAVAACPGSGDRTISIENSAEFKWLQALDNDKMKSNQRLIFIHDETFLSRHGQWQDYIPTDQSIGCFQSDPVFSTLIHELNVNSTPYLFFPDDTHGASSEKSTKDRIISQEDDLHEFKSLVSREHYLQLIYLANILK